jgi:hypothetical protein
LFTLFCFLLEIVQLRIQRSVHEQIEFASHAGVGGVGPGIFAVGGVLELAAAHGQAGQFVFHNKFSIECFVDSESG